MVDRRSIIEVAIELLEELEWKDKELLGYTRDELRIVLQELNEMYSEMDDENS